MVRWVVRSILHGVDPLEGTRSLAHHQLQQVHKTALTQTGFLVFTFVHGVMGRRIDPSWGGPIGGDLFASTPPATTWNTRQHLHRQGFSFYYILTRDQGLKRPVG